MKCIYNNKSIRDRKEIKRSLERFYNTDLRYISMLEAEDKGPFKFLVPLVEKWVPKGAKILDLGCGYGFSSYLLSQRGYRVTGIDLSVPLIQKAIERYGNIPNVNFKLGDAEQLEFSNEEFDAVVSWALLEHIVNVPKAINEMIRVVKKQGKIIVFASNLVSPFKPLGNLKKLMHGGKGHSMWGNNSKIKSFFFIMKNSFLTIVKLTKREAEIEYLEPNLSQVEPDSDRTWRSNQIDIKRYFMEKNCKILQYQVPGRKVQWLDHFDTMVQIVAQKV